MRLDRNMVAACQRQETVDDGMRVLCFWKHALIVLRHQRYSVLLKPTVGILVAEHVEQPLHQPVSSWIDLREVGHQAKGVGAVATSSPTHLYLRQHALAALEDRYLHLGHHLLQVDGEKKTCGTAAYHSCLHAQKVLYRHKGTHFLSANGTNVEINSYLCAQITNTLRPCFKSAVRTTT